MQITNKIKKKQTNKTPNVAQINEELKKTEYDGVFCKEIPTSNLQSFFIFSLT